ncbi:hypothetical protein SAMN05421688_0862 [Poseidonocella pacifica]|uniref:Gp5/Type VI secretion system Vgr protein OB-fold domain-containing protein n=1 Tax=Poseidonocella pacifica TaxID=871651 RepID=A0A1I0VR02_9RHOB|nr:phage baseplate assembly protein V [Poseidonocella pacifica]SFA78457.1 hypothetical protein SAMN05421688_0862 [Poseidonocella pacifica]
MSDGGMERLVAELADQVRRRYFGKYRGLVRDTADPRGMGRIRALVPEVLDDQIAPWALPCAPFTGDGMGQHTIPPVDAAVWIEFEAGDPSRPIWTGGWWGEGQVPKTNANAPATPPVKIIRTETGLMVSMDDDGQVIDVSDDSGTNLLKIEVQRGQILLKGAAKVVVEAPQIELVENATHPVVFGDQLLSYLGNLVATLQSHTHPGELAAGFIPVTPMVPGTVFPTPMPSLNSTRVKSG